MDSSGRQYTPIDERTGPRAEVLRARWRARMRARHRVAMAHHDEYRAALNLLRVKDAAIRAVEVAHREEFLRIYEAEKAKEPQLNPPAEVRADYAQRASIGVTPQVLAAQAGVPAKRMREWIDGADLDALEAGKMVRDRTEQVRQSERDRRALEEAWEAGRFCVVCRGPMPLDRERTCGHECKGLWYVARYQLSDDERDRQRLATARYTLANPGRFDEVQLRHARRVLSGEPVRSHGRWVSSPRVAEALERVEVLRAKVREEWGDRTTDEPAEAGGKGA